MTITIIFFIIFFVLILIITTITISSMTVISIIAVNAVIIIISFVRYSLLATGARQQHRFCCPWGLSLTCSPRDHFSHYMEAAALRPAKLYPRVHGLALHDATAS